MPTLLFVSTLLVAGCGGDDDGTDAAGTTTTTTSTTAPAETTTSEPGEQESSDPARAAQAEAAGLTLDDFPDGWEEHDPEAGLDLVVTWQDLIDCLGVDTTEPPLGIATSPTFLRGLGTQVRSTVEYRSEAQAQAIAAALEGPELERCATEAFAADVARSAPEGGVPGPVQVSPLEFAELGGSTVAIRANVTIDLEGLEVPIFQDLVVVFDGETVSRLVFLELGGEFPPELQRTLVETVVSRAGS